jgi:transcriptional regulator with XRE-family HTH domain
METAPKGQEKGRRGRPASGGWPYFADARRRADLTQTQVAARVGVSQAYVGEWERGETPPHWRYLLPLASVLRVELTDLAAELATFFCPLY